MVSTYVVVVVVVHSVNQSVTRVLAEKVDDMADMPSVADMDSMGPVDGME